MRAQAGATSDDSIVPGTWLPYNEVRFTKAVASGKVVVIDFTADWCIICKVAKRTILDKDPVRARFQQGDVVLLEGDCTSKRSAASAKLKALEQTGVPALAVYGPGLDPSKPPLIYNSYLPETIVSAVETAKGPGAPKVRVAEAPPAASH
jgi:thiol:disulfide interchange protein